MSLQSDFRLLYAIETQGLEVLDEIPAKQQKINLETSYSNTYLKIFEDILKSSVGAGKTYAQALDQMATAGKGADETIVAIARDIQSNIRAEQERTKALKATAAAEEENARKAVEASKRRQREADQEAAAYRRLQAAHAAALREDEQRSGPGPNLGGTLGGLGRAGGIGGVRALSSLGAAAGPAGLAIGGAIMAGMEGASIAKEAATNARELQNLAREMGITASQAFQLKAAANLAGQDLGSMSMAAKKLGQALEDPAGAGKQTAEEMAKLGISLKQDMGSALEEVIAKLGAIENPAERADAAVKLFGRNGEVFAQVAEQLKNVGQHLDEDVQEKLLQAQKSLADFGNTWTIVKGQMVAAFLDGTRAMDRWSSDFENVAWKDKAISGDLNPLGNRVRAELAKDQADMMANAKAHVLGLGDPGKVPSILGDSSALHAALNNDSKLGLDERIAQAKKDYEAARINAKSLETSGGQFKGDPIRQTEEFNKEAKNIDELRHKYEQLEAQKKSTAKAPGIAQFVDDYYTKATQGETGRLGQLRAEYENAIRDKGIKGSLATKFGEGYQENVRKVLAEYQQRAAKAAMADANANDKQIESGFALDGRLMVQQNNRTDEDLRKQFEEGQKLIEVLDRARDVKAQLNSRSNIQSIEGNADLFGDQNKINDLYQERIRYATELHDIQIADAQRGLTEESQKILRAKADAEFSQQQDEARLDREQQILEIRKQQGEATRSFATGLFNAGLEQGDGVSKYLKGFGKQIADTIVGNAGERVMGSLNSKLSLDRGGLLGTPDKPNFLGQMLKGTPLGFDPLKTAQDAKAKDDKDKPLTDNSTATAENTKATASLTAAIGALGGFDTSGLAGQSDVGAIAPTSTKSDTPSDKGISAAHIGTAITHGLGDIMKPFNSLAKMIGIGGTAGFIDGAISTAEKAGSTLSSMTGATTANQFHASTREQATTDPIAAIHKLLSTKPDQTDTPQPVAPIYQIPNLTPSATSDDLSRAPIIPAVPSQIGQIGVATNAYSDRPTAQTVFGRINQPPVAAPASLPAARPLPQGNTPNDTAPPARAVPLQVAAPEKQTATSTAIGDIKPTIDRLSDAVTSIGDSVNVNSTAPPPVATESTPYRGGLEPRDYSAPSPAPNDIRSIGSAPAPQIISAPQQPAQSPMTSIDAMTRVLRTVPQATVASDTQNSSLPAPSLAPSDDSSAPARPIWENQPIFRPLDDSFPPAPPIGQSSQSDIGSLADILSQQSSANQGISSPGVQPSDMSPAPAITPISTADSGGVRLAPFGTASGIGTNLGGPSPSLADIIGALPPQDSGPMSSTAIWNQTAQEIQQPNYNAPRITDMPKTDPAETAIAGLGKLGDSLAKNAGALSQSTNSTLSTLGDLGSGIGDVFSGQSVNVLLNGVKQNADGSAQSVDTTEQIGAGIGLGSTIAGGTMAAIQGFSKGGARGDLQGVGSILGTAAAVDPEPISKGILALGATITGLMSSLFGDPRQERIKQEEKTQIYDQYAAPGARDYNFSNQGGGAILDTGGGSSGGGRTANYSFVVHATDVNSFYSALKQDPSQLADAILVGLSQGGVGALSQELNWHLQHP